MGWDGRGTCQGSMDEDMDMDMDMDVYACVSSYVCLL